MVYRNNELNNKTKIIKLKTTSIYMELPVNNKTYFEAVDKACVMALKHCAHFAQLIEPQTFKTEQSKI